MLEGRDIICMNNDGLDGLRRPRAIVMEIFSKKNRVLFVSSASKSFFQRRGKAILPYGGLHTVTKSFHWLAPPTFLKEIYSPYLAQLDRLSAFCRYLCIRIAAASLGFKNPVLYIAAPHEEFILAAKRMKACAVVYNVHDKFLDESGNWVPQHYELLKCCDAVIATSREIESDVKKHHPVVYFQTHGVDTDLFRPRYPGYSSPKELENLPGPIIGLVGSLGDQMDWPMLYSVAKLKMEWSFVFVGPVVESVLRGNKTFSSLQQLPNVRFFPAQPHHRIPEFILSCDVCILPYVQSPYTMGVNPLKLLEYLACGKPVVCSPIPAAHDFSEYIGLATTLEEWISKLEEALNAPTNALAAKGMSLAADFSYQKRIESLSADLLTVINTKNGAVN